MLSAAENVRLTRVGPGSEMGALLRRYWHPIAAELELDEDPVRPVRLLGEDLVLFRDKAGRLGLIARRCPHRGVDLCAGMLEHDGLRCPYHGWKFDTAGRCLEQPFETTVHPDGTFATRVRTTAYEVALKAGLVWAYLGPLPAPCLPDWARFYAAGQARIGLTPMDCNWLQCQENSVDPLHVEWLHQNLPAHRYGAGQRGARHVKLAFDEFEHGFIYRRQLDNTDASHPLWAIGRVSLWPNCLYVGAFFYHVPIDDEHTLDVTWSLHGRDAAPSAGRVRVPYVRAPLVYEPSGRLSAHDTRHQDALVMLGQGAIVDRTREHLGESDRGIILLRNRLLAELDALPSGADPKGILRDPAKNHHVPLPFTPLHEEQPFVVGVGPGATLRSRVKHLLTTVQTRARQAASELERKARALRRKLERLSDAPDPGQLIEGYRPSALMFVAAELGVADALRDGPRSASELAQTLGAHGPSLARILDALAAHGLVGREAGRDGARYLERPVTRQLRRGERLHARALLVGREFAPAWLGLSHTARTGETAFDHVFGMSNWQHRAAHPELNDAFNTFMAGHTRFIAQRALAVIDIAERAHVIDLGGGTGGFLAELLHAHPAARGTLFEQAHVIDAARTNLASVADRCVTIAGDLFTSVPSGGDLYVLKHVLHDWDDARAGTILGAVAAASPRDARLWVIEAPLPDHGLGASELHAFDIHMLAVDGGRERRVGEYRALLEAAGFELTRVLPLIGPVRLMEARRST